MAKRVYKPIRREPKRIYARSIRNPRKRRRLFLLLLILGILMLIFLPGHNGLIKLISKQFEVKKLRREIEDLKIKIELVRAKIERTNDPEFIKRYAFDRYRMIPKDIEEK